MLNLQGLTLTEKLRRVGEVIHWRIAFSLPRRVVYFASVRLIAAATTGAHENQVVPELLAMDALKRWETPCIQD